MIIFMNSEVVCFFCQEWPLGVICFLSGCFFFSLNVFWVLFVLSFKLNPRFPLVLSRCLMFIFILDSCALTGVCFFIGLLFFQFSPHRSFPFPSFYSFLYLQVTSPFCVGFSFVLLGSFLFFPRRIFLLPLYVWFVCSHGSPYLSN